ncbi:MAG: deoxyribose-phosphate aldolase [Alcanivorax sp.]
MATNFSKNEKSDSGARQKDEVHSRLSLVDKVPRNTGTEFHREWIEDIRINLSAVERRIASLGARRSVKKEWQAAWLLKAITCIDLTSLGGDDTPGRIRRLCAKARNPVRMDVLSQLGTADLGLTTGAVCVYHEMIEPALAALADSGVPIAAVSTGFPAGLSPMETRLREIELSVAAGADEIDIVISRRKVLNSQWLDLYDEVRSFRAACGQARLKTILATGELGSIDNIAKASMVCLMAGADFIKTSTGMEAQNATLPISLVMVRMIREYLEMTGQKVGFKPAGGVRTAKQAINYLVLMKEELGNEWLEPQLFRFGASGLLGDIERQLEHNATGRYAAINHQPMA